MLKGLFGFLTAVLTVIIKFFRKKDKAREVLSDTPVIDQVREEAERKAEAKFGPRKG